MDSLIENVTSETLTAEDWTLIIGVCEQVEGSSLKAREAVNCIIKRLAHRNVNVVLYSLTLCNALVQNCSINLKVEVASRPFLGTLQRLLQNPKTHPAVKNRILDLIQSWAEAFRGESRLDFMGEIYRELSAEGYTFPSQLPPTPKKTTLSEKDKEEEELQLAMAISLSEANKAKAPAPPKAAPQKTSAAILFKVKALYDFNPSEEGELRLQKGQIVDVVDNSTFADWWKGNVNGQVGIFPCNYVAKVEEGRVVQRNIPDENAEVLQHMKAVADLKSAIMRADPLGHNQAENEKLQREYQKAVELVPLVLKRANAQRKKQDQLASLHERFSTAVATYQGIMNSYSLQRQQQQYQYGMQYQQQGYPNQQQQQAYPNQQQQFQHPY